MTAIWIRTLRLIIYTLKENKMPGKKANKKMPKKMMNGGKSSKKMPMMKKGGATGKKKK